MTKAKELFEVYNKELTKHVQQNLDILNIKISITSIRSQPPSTQSNKNNQKDDWEESPSQTMIEIDLAS